VNDIDQAQRLRTLLDHLVRDAFAAKDLHDWKQIEDKCVEAYRLAARVTDQHRAPA